MQSSNSQPARPARIKGLKVRNFRALGDVEFRKMKPMTALVGPNGSGKSTVFDVFAFLADCFDQGLRRAWDKRGRSRELKSRGADGPVMIEIMYRERPDRPLITYHLAVDEQNSSPCVIEEWLSLLTELAEECRAASERTQLLVTTHSPFFLNALRPDEVRVLWRDGYGYTHSERAVDRSGVPEFMAAGALLGDLWMEGHFGVGDPLVQQGDSTAAASSK